MVPVKAVLSVAVKLRSEVAAQSPKLGNGPLIGK